VLFTLKGCPQWGKDANVALNDEGFEFIFLTSLLQKEKNY
jgi:hypothetical protein